MSLHSLPAYLIISRFVTKTNIARAEKYKACSNERAYSPEKSWEACVGLDYKGVSSRWVE